MGVYLKPCTGCPLRAGCDQVETFRKRVSGLGLRSATFNCERLEKAIAPGTRVLVPHPIKVDTGGGYGATEYDFLRIDLPATILSADRDKFSCVIDRDALLAAIEDHGGEDAETVDTYRFRKTMPARRIARFLDEPKRKICFCGKSVLPDGQCDKRPNEGCMKAELSEVHP